VHVVLADRAVERGGGWRLTRLAENVLRSEVRQSVKLPVILCPDANLGCETNIGMDTLDLVHPR
jgi:dethiobiotin synthetase